MSVRRTFQTTGVAAGLLLLSTSPALADQTISSAGPLASITTTSDLNCALQRVGDSFGAWFDNTACGTLLASGGTLYGPAFIPAGGAATPRVAWTPVSQTPVTGSGTAGDPFTVVTVVQGGSSGLTVEQTDSYVEGEDGYRTSMTVRRAADSPAGDVTLYRAGDCFVSDDDNGYGELDLTSGAVTCRAADPQDLSQPGPRFLQLLPTTGGSRAQEDGFSTIWQRIGTQDQFANTCQCGLRIDNGMGLSWMFPLAPGSSVTQALVTTFSPIDNPPLVTAKTVDDDQVGPGDTVSYTITVTNPGSISASLTSVTDLLPAGFGYVPGSTTGVTTADPTVTPESGRSRLTWPVAESLAENESVSLTFSATASAVPGSYLNEAGGEADGRQVAPVRGADVTVAEAPAPVIPESPWTVLLPVAALGAVALTMRRRLAGV